MLFLLTLLVTSVLESTAFKTSLRREQSVASLGVGKYCKIRKSRTCGQIVKHVRLYEYRKKIESKIAFHFFWPF